MPSRHELMNAPVLLRDMHGAPARVGIFVHGGCLHGGQTECLFYAWDGEGVYARSGIICYAPT